MEYLGDRTGDEYRAHMVKIHEIVRRWHEGELTTAATRRQIAAENQRFYCGQQLAISQEPRIHDNIASIMAESGVPFEAAAAALDARRRANRRAESAESVEDARAEIEGGVA